MKTAILLIISFFILTNEVVAQDAGTTAAQQGDKSKMEIFKSWVGRWKGQGSIQRGPGEAKTSTVEERIEYKLDEMILTLEGIGKSGDNIVHHAFGVVSFDTRTNSYRLKSYLSDGKSADTGLVLLGENKYQWALDVPTGKIQYTITLDPGKKTWSEIGEFSADGKTWYKFFGMNLTKVQ